MPAPTPYKHSGIYNSIYEDHGCHAAPSCLSCPLLVCIEDLKEDRPGTGRNLPAAKLRYGIVSAAPAGGRTH